MIRSLASKSPLAALCVAVFSFAYCASAATGDNSVDTHPVSVWLLGGQSNMQGIGKLANLPATVPREIPYAYFWNGDAFEPFVLGQTRSSGRPGEFGPEVGFALNTAMPEEPAYLIKFYASGMPLHHGWNGNKWLGGQPSPGRTNFYSGLNSDDDDSGKLYRRMLDRFQAGLASLQEAGRKPVVRGFVWMQGEQDSKHAESAGAYAASLRRLRDRLAEDLKVESLPMVFGQVLPFEPAMPRFTHRDQIRQQMAWADQDSGRPEAIPLARMVTTDNCELLPDTVHYNAAGQLKLGRAMAKAMAQLASVSNDHEP